MAEENASSNFIDARSGNDRSGKDPNSASGLEREQLLAEIHDLKSKQSELVKANERLTQREKELLLRDIEVRTHLFELKVSQEDRDKLATENEAYEKIANELLDVSTALEKRNFELEQTMRVVREVNRATSLFDLMQSLLKIVLETIPAAQKGTVIRRQDASQTFKFIAAQGYDLAKLDSLELTEAEVKNRYFQRPYSGFPDFFLNNKFPEDETGKKFSIQRPFSSLAVAIKEANEVKGILFLDNFEAYEPFARKDLEIINRFKVHIESAFSRLNLLEQVQAQNREFERLNKELNGKNEELVIRAIEIRTALEELKATQDQLIVSEKLAALGKLISNMAHEINTPIGAINAAATNLLETLPGLLERLPGVLEGVSNEARGQFQELVEQFVRGDAATELSTQEARQCRKQIEEDLLRADVREGCAQLARLLIKLGVTERPLRFEALLRHPKNLELLETAVSIASLRIQTANIVSSVAKTQKTVLSYKSYTDDHTSQISGEIDVNESIEDILTVFKHLQNYGLKIVRQFAAGNPKLAGNPDQIKQVWSHIIHNAVGAMKNKGVLTISTAATRENNVVVEISDTGPGIPPKVRDRIFEPFFTTKEEGEGSGLGLHICKKIVDTHEGEIDVFSEPGRTTFTITLPQRKELL